MVGNMFFIDLQLNLIIFLLRDKEDGHLLLKLKCISNIKKSFIKMYQELNHVR